MSEYHPFDLQYNHLLYFFSWQYTLCALDTWLLTDTKKTGLGIFRIDSKKSSYWVETVESITDIKINNYEKQKRWKWESIQARLYQVNMRVLTINNAQNLGGQFIDNLKNLFITFIVQKQLSIRLIFKTK